MVDPVNSASSNSYQSPPDASTPIRRDAGDPAVLIAELIVISERTQDTARASRSANRAMRRELNEKRFDAMEDAADARFAGALIQSAHQAASGAMSIAQSGAQFDKADAIGAGDNVAAANAEARATAIGGSSQAIAAGGSLLGGIAGRIASDEDIEAARYQEAAQSASERADEASEDIRRAQGKQDKALQHLADISNARMQAQITASRG